MKKPSPSAIRKAMVGAALIAAPAFAFAGTGPYIGGEAGGNWVAGETFYGTPAGHLNKDLFGWTAGLVGGYQFSNGLRPELELNFRRNELRAPNAGFANATTAMANLWYDFTLPASWGVPALHPYVGGGVGFGRLGVARPGSKYRSAFMYQGGAGLDYDLTQHLTASVGWRWIQSGMKAATAFAGPNSDGLIGRYRANTALVGLRYSFGSAPTPVPVAAPVAPPPPPPPAKPACNPPAGFKVDANCHIIPQTVILRSINFKFNKATLTEPAKGTLDNVASALKQQPDLDVVIEGYTDSTGPAAYNKRLSQRRADSVRNYLVQDGVSGANLTAKGFGEADPVASNATRAGRTLNRRVQFRVTNDVAHVHVKSAAPTQASVHAATP
ncbi:MAG TPA: OmpA family protein [Nevskiaceae bacterium]|nr:OmpA family protein [Nevskiaceae bacterium]